jgi:transposase
MRSQIIKFRTAQINGRGMLAEYGEVMPQGKAGLRRGIAAALEGIEERVPGFLVETVREPWGCIGELDERMAQMEHRLARVMKVDEAAKRIAEIPGIGLLTATAARRLQPARQGATPALISGVRTTRLYHG